MDMNFELYEEGPVEWTRERVHVTLSKDFHLFFNKWALESLFTPRGDAPAGAPRRPEGVALLYDRRRSVIGVMPASLGKRHTYRLRQKKGMGDALVISVKGFCRHYGLKPAETVAFTGATVNRDGILVLDLQKVTAVGRTFSPQSAQRTQR